MNNKNKKKESNQQRYRNQNEAKTKSSIEIITKIWLNSELSASKKETDRINTRWTGRAWNNRNECQNKQKMEDRCKPIKPHWNIWPNISTCNSFLCAIKICYTQISVAFVFFLVSVALVFFQLNFAIFVHCPHIFLNPCRTLPQSLYLHVYLIVTLLWVCFHAYMCKYTYIYI